MQPMRLKPWHNSKWLRKGVSLKIHISIITRTLWKLQLVWHFQSRITFGSVRPIGLGIINTPSVCNYRMMSRWSVKLLNDSVLLRVGKSPRNSSNSDLASKRLHILVMGVNDSVWVACSDLSYERPYQDSSGCRFLFAVSRLLARSLTMHADL